MSRIRRPDAPNAPRTKAPRPRRPKPPGSPRPEGPRQRRPTSRSAPRRRQALTQVGGDVEIKGDQDLAAILRQAIAVPESQADTPDEARAHVHGFHTYPARLHPAIARRLIDALSAPKEVVFDPFVGSGTVLVEAMLAGRHAVGTDLNPLAVELSRVKTLLLRPAELERIQSRADAIADEADRRRKAKAKPHIRYSEDDVELFSPHVLLELDSLRHGVQATSDALARRVLRMVLSSLLVKLSKQQSDTSKHLVEQRIGRGMPARWFRRRSEELCARLAEWRSLLHDKTRRPHIMEDDATKLSNVHDDSVDLVICSPPYAGTYDYAWHHRMRARWLELDTRRFESNELGARRHYRGKPHAKKRAEEELVRVLAAVRPKLRAEGLIALIVADSVAGREVIRADAVARSAARAAGLECIASASQARPHFHGPTDRAYREAPRREHAILIRAQTV